METKIIALQTHKNLSSAIIERNKCHSQAFADHLSKTKGPQ